VISMDYQLFKELGVIAIVAGPLFFLIKWITEEFKVTLAAHREERKIWAELYSSHKSDLVAHSERAENFQRMVQEQHDRMMKNMDSACKEHQEMILTLGRINGYKDHS